MRCLSSGRTGRTSSSRPSSMTTRSGLGVAISSDTASILRLDQASPDRVANQLNAVPHAELSHRVGAVVLHRLLREMEDLGDLARGVGLSDELDDLLLARG